MRVASAASFAEATAVDLKRTDRMERAQAVAEEAEEKAAHTDLIRVAMAGMGITEEAEEAQAGLPMKRLVPGMGAVADLVEEEEAENKAAREVMEGEEEKA